MRCIDQGIFLELLLMIPLILININIYKNIEKELKTLRKN